MDDQKGAAMSNLEYIIGDIFDKPLEDGEYFVHCISSDCAMGRGIAVQFKNRFEEVKQLKPFSVRVGQAVLCQNDRVFNLVTKERFYMKPTYTTLGLSIDNMIQTITFMRMYETQINSLRMPKIGCGLDKLKWSGVSRMLIEKISTLNDFNITVYELEKGKR